MKMIRSVVYLVAMSVAMLATGANAFVTPSSPSANNVSSFAKPTTAATATATVRHPASKLEASSSGNEVYIEKDFRLSGIFLALGLLLDQIPYIQWTLGPLVTLLGVLFLVQTFRLKFACDATSFYLENTSQKSGENLIVGGENRWAYKSFVNYDFFPKGWIDQPQGPILVYFKETQTPSEKWSEGPGGIANSEETLAKGVKPGQVHFFPALCNTKQLRAEWDKRGCKKV